MPDNESFPDFSKVNLANDELNSDDRFVDNIRWQVTERELWRKKKKLKHLKSEYNVLYRRLSSKLSVEHWSTLIDLLNDKKHKVGEASQSVHNNKLRKLGIFPKVDSKNVTRRAHNNTVLADNIFNYSSYQLNDIERKLLSKGLKYGIKEKKVNTYEILARFE